jgi:hypothetical protein
LSRVSEKLASMNLTVWNIAVMLLWLGWGMIMASSEAYKQGLQGMNNVLIREWLASGQTDSLTLKVWFIGLCIMMIILGVNLIFCSWEKIFRLLRAKFNGPKLFMLIVHAVFGFVALGHLGGLMLGYKHSNVKLGEGQKYSFEDGYEVEVSKVVYTNDHKALKKSSRYITKDDFDYRKNFAEIVLKKDGEEVSRGKIHILNPLSFKGVQVTLRGFTESPESGNEKGSVSLTPWVTVNVSRNPVLTIYMILYPIMIAGIFIHMILTWRSPAINRANQEASNSN